MDCPNCNGTDKNCPTCEGTGKVKVGDGVKVQSFSVTDAYGADALVLDATPRKTKDGYLIAHAKVARTGIQLYRGDELGVPDQKVVRVFRPESEVFKPASMQTYAHKPITLDHPVEPVSAQNWKRLAGGDMGQEVVRDGHFISVPLKLMDAALIDTVERKQVKGLSVGYTMDLIFSPGTTKSGEQYDAIMSNIDVNHLAVVPAGRGGPELRIGDEHKERTMATKKFAIDGVTVEMEEIHSEVTQRAIKDRDTQVTSLKDQLTAATAAATAAKTASDAAIKELTDKVSAKDGEIVVLKKQVEDSKVTPAKLQELARDRATLFAKSVKLLGDKYPFNEKTDAEIMRDAVAKHMGDAEAKTVKDMDDAAIGGAFRAITKDVKVGDSTTNLANALSSAAAKTAQDGGTDTRREAFDTHTTQLSEAWRNPPSVQTKQ